MSDVFQDALDGFVRIVNPEDETLSRDLPSCPTDYSCKLINYVLDSELLEVESVSNIMFEIMDRSEQIEKFQKELLEYQSKTHFIEQCISLLVDKNHEDIIKIQKLENSGNS